MSDGVLHPHLSRAAQNYGFGGQEHLGMQEGRSNYTGWGGGGGGECWEAGALGE